MLKATKTLSLLALVVLLSACGKFSFGSRLVMEGKIAEAKFLTIDAGKALGFGVCSPITISAWARAGVAGGSLTPVQLTLAGLRSGDTVYSDAACTKSVKADQLSLPAVAVSVTYYLKTGSVGQVALNVVPVGERFSAVTQSVPVSIILASLAFNTTSSIALPAGYCSSPIGINLRDGAGAPFSATNQSVQLLGAEGIAFSDSRCLTPLSAATLKVNGSSAAVYFKRNTAAGGALTVVLKDPGNSGVATASLSVVFTSVPHHLEITGGPASLVLGVCNTAGVQIRLLDVDGNLASPVTGSALTVQIGSVSPATVSYRLSCSGVAGIKTNLVFNAGESSKTVYVDARSQGSVTLRAWIDGSSIVDGFKGPISVERLPVSIDLAGPSEILAGSAASFTVSLKDGLDNPLPTNSNLVVTLTEGTPGKGSFSSSTIAILQGYSSSTFTYTPNSNSTDFTQTISAASTVNSRTISGATSLIVKPRIPKKIVISEGPSGQLDLGVCAAVPFKVTLLAEDDRPVAPVGGTTVTVAMGFSSGSGVYQSGCGNAAVTSLAFTSNDSLYLNLVPTADFSLTLRATGTDLATGLKSVSIKPAVPAAVLLSGPDAVTAGVPAGPYTVTVKDAINRNIAAGSGGVSVYLSIASSARASFCTSAKCPTALSSMSLAISQGYAVSTSFYLLSDSDSTQSPVAGGMSATPTNGLRASNLPLSITRSSLALDPNFGAAGQLPVPMYGLDGGEIRASVFSGGKLTVAGFQNKYGSKRVAMARINADRATSTGALDGTFTGDGTMTLNVGDESWASAIAAQGTGYLIAGSTRSGPGNSGDYNIFLQRVNSYGMPDTSFRFVGSSPDPFVLAGNQFATSIVIGSDNTIYVVGYTDPASPSASNTSDLLVVAFNSDGSPIAGAVDTYDFNGSSEIASSALLQDMGGIDRILIGGSIGTGTSADALFVRVMGLRGSTGMNFLSTDAGFGNGGMVRYDLGGYADSVRAMAMQPSNRLVAVGSRGKSSGTGVSMIGLQLNGNRDSGFGSNGIANYEIPSVVNATANDIALDSRNGAIYLAGSADDTLLFARYNQDGTSDGLASTARPSGSAPVAYALALGQDGKPIAAGVNNGVFNIWGALR